MGTVLPAVEEQVENISKVIEMLEEKVKAKLGETNAYREKHQILVQGMSKAGSPPSQGGSKAGVLVA